MYFSATTVRRAAVGSSALSRVSDLNFLTKQGPMRLSLFEMLVAEGLGMRLLVGALSVLKILCVILVACGLGSEGQFSQPNRAIPSRKGTA